METSPIKFRQFSGAPGFTFDQGLIKIVNSVKVDLNTGADEQGTGAAGGVSGLEFNADTTSGMLRVKVDPVKAIGRYANGIGIKLNGTTLEFEGTNPTAGIRVKGLPATFEIGGSAVSANVSASNLTELTGGGSTSLHTHSAVPATEAPKVEMDMDTTGGTVALGDPVYISASGTVDEADTTDAKAKVIGVARLAPTANVAPVVMHGVADGILTTASPGTPYYLATGGGLSTSLPGGGKRVIQCGIAWTASDLFVRIVDYGKKAA
jgi:hypothetical protein